MKIDKKEKIRVYYNSACPACDKGVKWQKGKTSSCDISWENIHKENQLVNEIDEEIETVRKYLHLGCNNKVYTGINAFIKIWGNSPEEVWKAKLVSLPVIKQMSILTYFLFANLLYYCNRFFNRW